VKSDNGKKHKFKNKSIYTQEFLFLIVPGNHIFFMIPAL